MKNKSLIDFLFGVFVAGLMVSCMGMEEEGHYSLLMPEVKAFNVKDNGSLVFELSATVDKSAASRIAECGFYYGKDKNMYDAERIECKMLGGTFSADIILHEYGETFYACSYISNGTEGNEICSEPKSIAVKELEEYVEFGQVALVSYDRATQVASVSISYEVTEGVEITSRGLCYGTSKDLSVNGNNLKDENFSSGSVTYEIPGVEAGKAYYVRPYLYDGEELAYGQVQELHAYAVPVVEIGEVSEVKSDCASVSCKVVDDCGKAITSRGVVYVKGDGDPTLNTGKSVVSGTIGEYTVTLSGLSPNTLYSVRAYAENEKGVAYSGERQTFTTAKLDMSKIIDLSSSGTSNCYIVSKAGMRRFPTVKGNSRVSVGEVVSVEALWESFGTSTVPSVGSLIKSAFYNDGYVVFETPATFKEGNAVIAAKDASGKILWSWHIWMTDEPGKCVYANNAGTMMDRNLGATSATPGDVGALGLLYQWGRKDPFLGSSSISESVEAKSTLNWPSPVPSSSSHGTIAYATEHPTTFITLNNNNFDWYYSGSSSTDNTRWQSNKTIYDPCPAGWRVPDGGSTGVWAQAGFPSVSEFHPYDSIDEGMLFGDGISSPASWYPAAGRRGGDESLEWVGVFCSYWSVTPNSYEAYSFYFDSGDYVSYISGGCRVQGHSVRCLQE